MLILTSPGDVMMYEVFLVTSQLEPLWSQSFSRIFFQTTAHNLLRYLFRQNFSQLSIQIQNVEGRKCLVRIEHKWEVETFNKSYQKMSKGSHLWFNSIKSLEEPSDIKLMRLPSKGWIIWSAI